MRTRERERERDTEREREREREWRMISITSFDPTKYHAIFIRQQGPTCAAVGIH